MSYHIVGNNGEYLGFSLKPPKWIRKMQPGKVLLKAAPFIAGAAASLLIPGVGGALVKAATTTAKFGWGAGKMIGRAAAQIPRTTAAVTKTMQSVAPLAQTFAPAQTDMIPGVGTPAAAMAMPQAPLAPSSYGGSASTPAASGTSVMTSPDAAASSAAPVAGEFPMMPLVLAGGAALILFTMMGSRRRA